MTNEHEPKPSIPPSAANFPRATGIGHLTAVGGGIEGLQENMSNHAEEFRAAMRANGLDYSGPIIQDGIRHRVKCDDDKEAATWYILHHPDPIAAGIFGCWKRGIKQTWKENGKSNINREQLDSLKKRWAQEARAAEAEQEELHRRNAEKAAKEVAALPQLKESHDYLDNKKVPALGDLRLNAAGDLVLPLVDANNKIWSYQTIDFLGDKLFMPGGRVQGCYFPIGDFDSGPVVICEGYATGATIHLATKWPVVCAMNCGNLKKVATDLKRAHPDRTFVIAADNDRFTRNNDGSPRNPGVEKAQEAGLLIKSLVCIPDFPDSGKGTDFNDLALQCGEGVVRSQFTSLLGLGMGQRITIRDLLSFSAEDDKDSMLGKRYLCLGGSCVIVGQTSAGKSSLGMQMAVMWALGQDFFGLRPRRPLRSLYIQAENDTGDTAEMFQGILLGLGLVDENNPEQNNALVRILEKNLIIVRDQTHIGPSFPSYAAKMVEIHKPDIFWVDPLLSFFGDDINDQKAMSLFLRSELNPISERTGIIWMLMHHTGKPQKDASKQQKSWSARDFAYMGLGSSELSNWARAIITVVNQGEDEFRVVFAKRGWRSGVVDDKGDPCTELNLAHSGDYICWKRIPKPKPDDEMEDVYGAFANTITTPMSATAIVKQAADQLKRGERTVWKAWGGGDGPLGKYFHKDGNFWVKNTGQKATPYKDD